MLVVKLGGEMQGRVVTEMGMRKNLWRRLECDGSLDAQDSYRPAEMPRPRRSVESRGIALCLVQSELGPSQCQFCVPYPHPVLGVFAWRLRCDRRRERAGAALLSSVRTAPAFFRGLPGVHCLARLSRESSALDHPRWIEFAFCRP